MTLSCLATDPELLILTASGEFLLFRFDSFESALTELESSSLMSKSNKFVEVLAR